MTRTLSLVCSACLALAACGPSAHRVTAEDTVRSASRAVAEIHASGGESPEVRTALEDTEVWLAHSEEAVNEWGSGPRSMAWETMAPCLARAMRDLRDALLAQGRTVPSDLDEAEASAGAIAEHECPRLAGDPPDEATPDPTDEPDDDALAAPR